MNHSVVFENVTKKYKMYKDSTERLKGVIAPNRSGEDFYAVKNVSFVAGPGDVIGIVGVNGAGKSTLSNILAGVIPETSGNVTINGKVAVISISSGLDGQLTGRDNIEYKCLMLGFSKKEIDGMMPEIIDFADIGNFIDQPVKNYSSGMKSRLGFAIAVNIDPDVLVIDEALSVGDQTFREKCFEKMDEFKEKGKTIFFVSHSLNQVRDFCNKVLWLEAGEVRGFGKRINVLPQYRKFLRGFQTLSPDEQKNFRAEVAERRSKLETFEELKEEVNKKDSGDPPYIPFYESSSRTLRKKKNRKLGYLNKNVMLSIVLLLAVAIALIVVQPWNLISRDKVEPKSVPSEGDGEIAGGVIGIEGRVDESSEETEEIESTTQDVRYVAVESASIRETPSLNGELLAYAIIGEAYVIEDIEIGTDEIEWLRIAHPSSPEYGWISGNIMEERSSTIEDAELASTIQALIGGYYNELEAISKGDTIASDEPISIPVTYLLKEQVIENLDEPHLESSTMLLFHGTSYDFRFTMENDIVKNMIISDSGT